METHCKNQHILSEENTYMRSDGYIECRSCRKQAKRIWAERHREKAREHSQRHFLNNKEAILEKNRRWAKANPEKIREKSKRKYRRNPRPTRERTRRWRARKLRQLGNVSPDIEISLLASQGGKCYYCQISIEGKSQHVDHKMPLSRGGLHDDNNLCLTCPPCNLKKGTKTEAEFRGGEKLMELLKWTQ